MKHLFLLFFVVITLPTWAMEHRWLEQERTQWGYTPTIRQTEWFEQQKILLQEYHSRISQPDVEERFQTYFEEAYKLQKVTLDNGKVLKTELSPGAGQQQLVYDGKVIINQDSLETLMLAYGIQANFSFNSFAFSPDKKHIVVPVHERGSSLEAHLMVYAVEEELNLVGVIPNVDYEDAYYWKDSQRLIFEPGMSYFGGTHIFDVSTGEIKVDYNQSLRGWKSIDRGEYLYQQESLSEIAMQAFSSDEIAKIDLPTHEVLDFKGKTNSYFVFANSYNNAQKLYFIYYSKDENSQLKLDKVKSYEPIQSGSMQRFLTSGDYLLVEYMAGPFKTYRLINKEGDQVRLLNSPKAGRVRSFKHIEGQTFEFTFMSEIYREFKYTMDFATQTWNPNEIQRQLLTDESGVEFEQRYMFIPSFDGVSIPTRLIYKKGVVPQKSTPLYVSAYGGHGLIADFNPAFDIGVQLFLEKGGIYVAPAIRGGGEYGDKWYEPMIKSLVRYKDLEAVIRQLHGDEVGSPSTTAFEGWSSGGLLAGVMLTRTPELFQLVIPGNGLQDMLRKEILDYDRDRGWSGTYGEHETEEDIDFLKSYSPYLHAEKPTAWPTVYVINGADDRRVNPGHSYKFVAALQKSQQGTNPILLDRFEKSGHRPLSIGYMGKSPLPGQSALDGQIRKWKVIFQELGVGQTPLQRN